MKTLKDLFELVALAVEQNSKFSNDWFIEYSGHINKLRVSYYFVGWTSEHHNSGDIIEFKLNDDGIQAAYWFIKTRLK